MVCLRKSSRCRFRLGADSRVRTAPHRSRTARSRRTRNSQAVGLTVAATAANAAKPSGRVEQSSRGTAAGARERQPALAVHDAAATGGRATAIFPVARHAAGAAPGGASALAAVQISASRPAAAGTRIFQPVSPNAAGAAHATASTMASDDAGPAASCGAVHARRAAAAASAAAVTRLPHTAGGWPLDATCARARVSRNDRCFRRVGAQGW
jgi:hypothetical protein